MAKILEKLDNRPLEIRPLRPQTGITIALIILGVAITAVAVNAESGGDICPTHVVESGQSLSVIGSLYGVPWKSIYEKNRDLIGGNPGLIRPGQRFLVCNPSEEILNARGGGGNPLVGIPQEKPTPAATKISELSADQKAPIPMSPHDRLLIFLNNPGSMTLEIDRKENQDITGVVYNSDQFNALFSGEKEPPKGRLETKKAKPDVLTWTGGNANNAGQKTWLIIISNESDKPSTPNLSMFEGEAGCNGISTIIRESFDGGKTYINWPFCKRK